jgi:DNA ligase (NAD+)
LDIKGLSKATLEKLITWNWVSNFKDLYKLKNYREEWIKKEGFGIKSVDNILTAIENSKHCDLNQFIAALGIPLIGTTAAKDLAHHFGSWTEFINAIETKFKFYSLPNFGIETHQQIIKYNYSEAIEIVNNYIVFNEHINESEKKTLEGLVFVVTGRVNRFKNRDELKEKIESYGGKVTGSISKNTNYLINNDVNSTSSKNRTAKSMNIPILSEDLFIETFGVE